MSKALEAAAWAADLPALLSRLEAAEGEDRELDGLLAKLVGDLPAEAYWSTQDVYGYSTRHWVSGGYGAYKFYDPEPYTASLDAAIALCERVLPGSLWSIAQFRQPVRNHARVFNVRKMSPCVNDDDFYGDAPTPALALCIAIVKALIAQGQRDD